MNKLYSLEFKSKVVNAHLRGKSISGLGSMKLKKRKIRRTFQSICGQSMISKQDVNGWKPL